METAQYMQLFDRFEIKYLLEKDQFASTQNILSKLLVADENKDYFIQSIYFDSPYYHFYTEKHEGMESRLKPRLRFYRQTLDAPAGDIFFEFKYRLDRNIKKERIKISRSLASDLLRGDFSNHDPEITSSPILSKFNYLTKKYTLKPSINILYHRQAFFSKVFSNIRLTYDTRLSSSLAINDLSLPLSSLRHTLDPRYVILELKYNKTLPQIILNHIQMAQLQQLSISKYALCLEHLYSDPSKYRVF